MEGIASRYDDEAKRSQGSRETEQCDQGDDKRYSDLCAQWKAADAAADSAWWAAVGGFATAISTILVLIALRLAFGSNRIARDTAKRQLRAYVSVTDTGFFADGVNRIGASVTMRNDGETPASDLTANLFISIQHGSPREISLDGREATTDASRVVLGRGGEQGLSHSIKIPGKTSHEILSGDYTIFAFGGIRYADIFGFIHETRYCSFSSLHSRGSKQVVCVAPFGNSAT